MKLDTCDKDSKKLKQHHGYKSIRLPFDEKEYINLLNNNKLFKEQLDKFIEKYPWLFPCEISDGYSLFGFCPESKKQDILVRRIILKQTQKVYQIYPSFVMPYMTELTDTAEKILLLAQHNNPNWLLAIVFKMNEKHVERLTAHLGKCSIVGTTVSGKAIIPKDLIGDEKHSSCHGDKCYIATVVAKDCILGASVTQGADEIDLTKGYGIFKQECIDIQSDYQPETVNTDGWTATGNAFKTLFPCICIIFCFLHALLSIKNVATKKTEDIFSQIKDKVWNIYKSKDKHTFAQRIRRLMEWIKDCKDTKIKDKVIKLCNRKSNFMKCYDFENAYRTSNMIDRTMDSMDKFLYLRKYFHGSLPVAENTIRAFSLSYNFRPYCPKTQKLKNGVRSPFEQLNGFVYHDDWLQNLLVATSRNGFRGFQQKK